MHGQGYAAARVYNPVWLNRPGESDMARAYPQRARRRGLEGSATLDCLISDTGRLSDCAVVSAQPAGLGFGPAALRLAPQFRADRTNVSGWPVSGYRVRVPVEWGAKSPASSAEASPGTAQPDLY
jgi:protein TonB